MKVWNDFFIKYPTQKYALVFEDDFVISKNSKSIMKKAVDFIDENYKDIDLLFLHNLRVYHQHTQQSRYHKILS